MSMFRSRIKAEATPASESRIRVCVVSRDEALAEEVHQDLQVGFLTRGGYDFRSDHPDFQEYCDVLFLDLRAAGFAADAREMLAFIEAVHKSVSHPPIVALCDGGESEFAREVMQCGAFDKLIAPLNAPQLRLSLQRAYEFRATETKLESFLTAQTAARDRVRGKNRKMRAPARPAPRVPRAARSATRRPGPSRLAVGFVLGCVLFFAGLVAVRTILVGMGDALASAGSVVDSASSTPAVAGGAEAPRAGAFATQLARPFAGAADFGERPFETDRSAPAVVRSSLPGYEPAAIAEHVAPRYSADARARHLEGTVRIRAIIGKDGTPRGLARASGDATLAQIAMDAIALWRYNPATVDGEPVESEVIIPINFQLPN